MKPFQLLVFLFFIVNSVFSQDIIRKNNGDTLRCKISEINPVYLKFKTDSTTHFLSLDSISGYKLEFSDFVQVSKYDIVKKYNNGKIPNKYFLSISPGIGENHGIGGIKILLGPEATSGIFASVGYGVVSVFWKFGLQANVKWIYFAGSIGPVAFIKRGLSNIESIIGLTLETGAQINLSRNKRFFIQFGLGYNLPLEDVEPVYFYYYYYTPTQIVDFSGIRPEIGLGVKF